MKNLKISVANKVATYYQRDGFIVCGNKDYKITFAFDSEWNAHPVKTARFKWNDVYADVVLVDGVADVPKISNATEVEVGVYAGDLCTTTPATIPCVKSILCGESTHDDPTPDVYAQIINLLESGLKGPPGEQGEQGKSAYEVACDNNFEGTEEEWLASLKGDNADMTKVIGTINETISYLNDTTYTASYIIKASLITEPSADGYSVKAAIELPLGEYSDSVYNVALVTDRNTPNSIVLLSVRGNTANILGTVHDNTRDYTIYITYQRKPKLIK